LKSKDGGRYFRIAEENGITVVFIVFSVMRSRLELETKSLIRLIVGFLELRCHACSLNALD